MTYFRDRGIFYTWPAAGQPPATNFLQLCSCSLRFAAFFSLVFSVALPTLLGGA
jgi:hypothetical protein